MAERIRGSLKVLWWALSGAGGIIVDFTLYLRDSVLRL